MANVAELREQLDALGIEVPSGALKADLVELLADQQDNNPEPVKSGPGARSSDIKQPGDDIGGFIS